MTNSTTRQKTSTDRCFDCLINALRAFSIKASVVRWYVFGVEEYIKAFHDRHLTFHTRNDLESYFQAPGRKNHLEDWQFRQTVDAIQILFRQIVKAPWVDEVDWDYWLQPAHRIPDDHATLARDYRPLPGKSTLQKTEPLAPVRESHRQVLEDLRIEVRRRGYSIRTEKAYGGWVCRYLAFRSCRNLHASREEAVSGFLEHMAVRGKVVASTQNQAPNFDVTTGI